MLNCRSGAVVSLTIPLVSQDQITLDVLFLALRENLN